MEKIGYKPLSNRIKPVHIANGLFREILGTQYSLETMNTWSKRFKSGKEINSANDIKSKYSEIIDEDMSLDEINELRGYIGQLLDSDKAVTPELKFSALTIASKTQVGSEVQNEFKIPGFLFRILNTKVDEQISPSLKKVKELLNDETDEISKFIRPLTNIDVKSKELEKVKPIETSLTGVELQIRKGFDKLVGNSKTNANKLLFLQRFITYSCFAIMYHLSSKFLDISNRFDSRDRIPLVLDANIGNDSIRIASQESLLLARLNIENFYEKTVENILLANEYSNKTKEDILEEINKLSFKQKKVKKANDNETEPNEEMKNVFIGYFNQTGNLIESYARAIRLIMFSKVINSSDPATSYVALGAKIGLIYGRTKKRYLPTPNILEVLILSVLNDGEMLTLSDFGRKICGDFGIIIGANPEEDVQQLKMWDISEHVPGDLYTSLAENADALSEIYISMGYAKRYADGVIIFSLNK
ncbi:hypothetical protein P4S95_27060 [Aneurinibacillus aneurinilyticus]|uniref:hypothetical protein n=1 Tax=Aneurinibacillus aneurinilyticus TaxID=1391 RepID=UPI002E1FAA59|nr:hypothetical protein [Aneurinibacillus aneurinilyticus]